MDKRGFHARDSEDLRNNRFHRPPVFNQGLTRSSDSHSYFHRPYGEDSRFDSRPGIVDSRRVYERPTEINKAAISPPVFIFGSGCAGISATFLPRQSGFMF